MTPEEYIQQALQRAHFDTEMAGKMTAIEDVQRHALAAIQEAVAAEREACAQIAESFIVESEHLVQLTAREIAAAIRARQAP